MSIGPHPGLQEIAESPEPLPGGVADVVRFLFHVPQWIQIGGAVLAAIAAIGVATLAWRRRSEIAGWIRTRSAALQAALAVLLLAVITAAAWAGAESWDYMHHDNAFCTGCHVMGESFRKFRQSEHADLSCHDCHQQSLYASARQVYLWVLERPEEIGAHSPVPNERCVSCHVTERPDSVWQRISSTAGHRVHLESDSSALGDVMCVTCHGVEVHRFVPARETCGQADCHSEEDTDVVLGEMATAATGMHCLACHDFTAPVPEATPLDTAITALRPGSGKCLGWHEMEKVMADFRPRADPHRGACGACHDPHTQTTPDAAFETCTGSGCHTEPAESTRFHRGLHDGVLAECGRCHGAHDWRVSGTECVACHDDLP
jgi:nitrate/TMAO reductase-like tetraheme cytochrome c subunit